MNGFRALLILIFAVILIYTVIVIEAHGLGLFQVFFGDIVEMAWPGQFNLDFMCFLILSATWVSWRHHFSAGGLAFGAIAFVGGAPFLSVYLFVESFRTGGNMGSLLLGHRRAAALSQ